MSNIVLDGMTSRDLIQIRDSLRLADGLISVELWERQKEHGGVFKSGYIPDERILHYEEKVDKYKDKCVVHGVTDILNVLNLKVPDTIINVVKGFFKLFNLIKF